MLIPLCLLSTISNLFGEPASIGFPAVQVQNLKKDEATGCNIDFRALADLYGDNRLVATLNRGHP